MDVCFQADINQEADQFEEVLRQNRAKMEAASRELADWELQTARARNEGTFFKGLFKADILQQPSAESRAPHQPELPAEVLLLTLQPAYRAHTSSSPTTHDLTAPCREPPCRGQCLHPAASKFESALHVD